jgi:hypothetical protein
MPFPILGALIGAGANLIGAGIAARRNKQDNARINQAQTANTGILDTFETKYGGTFDPSIATANTGAGLYADALGINGAEGNGRATGAFQAGPGYGFAMDQGLQGVTRAASAGGMLASGNTMNAAQKYGQGLANQEYGNWLGRLAPYVGEQRTGLENKAALGSLISTGRMENNNAGIDRLQSNINGRQQNIGGFLGSAANLFGRAAGYKGY